MGLTTTGGGAGGGGLTTGGGGFGVTIGGQSLFEVLLLLQSTTGLADCAVENWGIMPAETVNIPAKATDFI